ncbi:hypothetical protein ACFCYN_02335 [Gottfriedia sp. NPDC056225]|uniref:hypothetical protein n=1 Tax=Gottfriedia sp. NPDC056225 TaxID=3345751 RepID=UPI0035D592B9
MEKRTTTKKYLPYFFSYLLVYPCSFPLVVIIGLATASLSESKANVVSYIVCALVTIVGAIILNLYFKNFMELKKNNKQTWSIFITHLILIPLTVIIYYWVTWNFF